MATALSTKRSSNFAVKRIAVRYRAQMWPLSRYPEILPRGEAFVKSWGVPSIFIGRFFGPLRASVPLAAGIFEMPYWPFQIANFVSALVWSAALLLFGDVIAQIAEWLWRVV